MIHDLTSGAETALHAAFMAAHPGSGSIGGPALTAIYALSVDADAVAAVHPADRLRLWARILEDAAGRVG